MARPTSSPDPAASAAGPNAANTPAPIIEPSPMTMASRRPSRRASRLGRSSPTGNDPVSLVVPHELDLEAAGLLEEGGVHAREVAPVRRLARLHARPEELLVGPLHVRGAEPE